MRYKSGLLILIFLVGWSCAARSFRKGGQRDFSPAGKVARSESKRVTGGKTADIKTFEKKRVRKVVYRSNLELEIPVLAEGPVAALKITKKYKGFVESRETFAARGTARIVLRIPVKDFEAALEELTALGKVLRREIRARDVTREFYDLESRIKNAREVRARLYKLMKAVKSVKQRVKILREIDRLTRKIDAWVVRRDFLKNRADFSTIVILFRTPRLERLESFIPSPFPWISRLRHNSRSIRGFADLDIKRPAGFYDHTFRFRFRRGPYRFISPDGAVIRTGYLKNRPRGDLKFWTKALQIEFKKRGYKLVEDKAHPRQGHVFLLSFKEGYRTVYYWFYFFVDGGNLCVLEAYLPGDPIWKKHNKTIRRLIQNMGEKK